MDCEGCILAVVVKRAPQQLVMLILIANPKLHGTMVRRPYLGVRGRHRRGQRQKQNTTPQNWELTHWMGLPQSTSYDLTAMFPLTSQPITYTGARPYAAPQLNFLSTAPAPPRRLHEFA